jgi:hypothetical protein
MEKFPNAVVLYEHFSETLRYTVDSFRKGGSGSLEVVNQRFIVGKILRLWSIEWKTNLK